MRRREQDRTAEPEALEISNVQVFPIKEPLGKVRAFVRLVLGGQLQLTGLKIIEGTNGLFVSYPNDPSYKGEDFRSIYYPVTKTLREEIERVALEKYQEALEMATA